MALVQTFCGSISFIESLVPLPFQCNRKTLKLEPNPSYCSTCTKIYRHLIYSILLSSFIFSTLRLCWLYREWNNGSTYLLTPAPVGLSSYCMTVLVAVSISILNENGEAISFLVNQSFSVTVPLDPRTTCNIIYKIILHIVPAFLVIIPLSCLTLLLNVQLLENMFGATYALAAIGLIVYCLAITHGIGTLIVAVIIILVLAENLTVLTSQLHATSGKSRVASMKRDFLETYRYLEMSRIFITLLTNSFQYLLTTGILLSVLLSTYCTYIFLTMYGVQPMGYYLAVSVGGPITFGFDLTTTYLGGLIYNHVELSKKYWGFRAEKRV